MFILFVLAAVYLFCYRPKSGVYVVWVHIDIGNKEWVRPRGFDECIKLNKWMTAPEGWLPWPHNFSDDPEYIGPILFDDWNKEFMPINPNTAVMLDRICLVRDRYNINEIIDYEVLYKVKEATL